MKRRTSTGKIAVIVGGIVAVGIFILLFQSGANIANVSENHVPNSVLHNCTLKTDGSGQVDVSCNGYSELHLWRDPPLKPVSVSGVTLIVKEQNYYVEFRAPAGGIVSYNLVEIPTKSKNIPDLGKTIQQTKTKAEQIAKSVEKSIPKSVEPVQKSLDEYIPKTDTKQIPLSEMYSHALNLVNADRAEKGLAPVHLSQNQAAQAHAEDVLKMRTISHWMTNGEKPYMTYTRYDGTGYVGQNVAFGGYADISECSRPLVICEPIKPMSSIENSEYSMIHDDAASGWGHRDNILDPHHTHVSFGVAYDQYSYAFVENFEDNYIDFSSPIGTDPSDVRIVGNVISGELANVSVYYDSYPSSELYSIHRSDTSYGMGDLVAVVVEPLPSNSYYDSPTGYSLIVAKSMSQSGNSINVVFDMSPVVTRSGVYTIVVWLKDGGIDVPATSYSMFVK